MFELLAPALQLAAAGNTNRLWYALPLVVSVSLVYGAPRHELVGPILNHAFRAAVWIGSFMAIIFAVLLLISWAV